MDEEPEIDWKSEKQSETDPVKSHPDEGPRRNRRREEPGWSQKPYGQMWRQERWRPRQNQGDKETG